MSEHPSPVPDEEWQTRLDLYAGMVRLREFERRVQGLFLEGLVKGTTHLGLGQEAVAAGFAKALLPDDYTLATYRGHNHVLARGVPMVAVMGELMGRACGLNGGKGGSMHLTSVEHKMLGSYAIVGAHLTVANGVGLSARARGTSQAVVCFFGDGATNIGAFHEALNLAAVWKLPVVFVCENNLYMEYTPIGTVTAVEHPAAGRAASYGLEPLVVDGNDVMAVLEVAERTLARAREGGGPSLVEALTYRHSGHSRVDPGKYRPAAEVEAWLSRDPIARLRRELASTLGEPALREIEDRTEREVTESVADAQASPPPDPSTLRDHVFFGGGSWRA